MSALFRLLTLLLLLVVPGLAGAAGDPLREARNTFEYGDYEASSRIAEKLLSTQQLSLERELVEAHRIAGLSHFFLGRSEAARRSFIGMLSVDPDAAMDPFLVPPAAVAFFDGVKRDNEKLLGPIREQRKALAEQERRAEEARRRLLDESLRRTLEPERPLLVKQLEVHTFAVNFLPFGAGQFQQGRNGWGAGFATLQLLALGTAAGSFAGIESLREPSGKYSRTNVGTAQALATAKWTSLGVAGIAFVGGVVDALWHHQDVTERIVAVPVTPNREMPGAPAAAPAPAPTEPTPAQPTPAAPTTPSMPPAPAPPTPAPLELRPVPAPAPAPTTSLAPLLTPQLFGVGLSGRF